MSHDAYQIINVEKENRRVGGGGTLGAWIPERLRSLRLRHEARDHSKVEACPKEGRRRRPESLQRWGNSSSLSHFFLRNINKLLHEFPHKFNEMPATPTLCTFGALLGFPLWSPKPWGPAFPFPWILSSTAVYPCGCPMPLVTQHRRH